MTDGRLRGKVALVTGGSRGIGAGIARAFAREGCSLVLVARTAEPLEALAAELRDDGAEVVACVADVSDATAMQSAFQQARDRFGRLDLLVNNAGTSVRASIEELSLEDWDRILATNLRGPFLATRMAFSIMKEQGGGRILNIGSISGRRVRPETAAYAASKHGLWGLTQVTALEGRPHGITCGCIHPGNVATKRRERVADGEPRMRIEDVAEVALLMAALPPDVAMLDTTVLPREQPYLGRG